MSFKKYTVLITLIISVLLGQSEAQTKLSAQSVMKFLNISIGARAAGMGDSFINNGDDISVAFWNPAGIGQINGFNTMVEMNRWISDVSQYSFVASKDIGDLGVFGVTFTMMDYGEIHGTTIDLVSAGSGAFEYIETGNVSVSNFALGLVYARAISNQFSIGGQVRYVYSGLGSNLIQSTGSPEKLDNNLSALAFDLGTRFNTEFKDLTFSMSLRNFSGEVRYPRMSQGYYLPLLFTLGFSIDAAALIFPENVMHSLVVSVNGLHPMDYSEKMNIGAEYGFQKQFFLRGGYKFNYSIESYSTGIGLRYPISNEEYLQFDYSFSAIKYFNGVHRISISSHF
jgi:hypothetical protein